jgi:capsular exopolysaccharide synthesis family protein
MGSSETAGAQTGESEFDLRYYASLLWRGRWLIVTGAVVGAALGIVYGFLQVPAYRATATLKLEPPTPHFMDVNQVAMYGSGNYWANLGFYNTEYQILHSQPIAEGIVERLKLTDRPPFKDDPDAARIVLGHVSVAPVPETQLVSLTVAHQDPQTAALWANTWAEVYIEQTIETRIDSARRAYDWLQERISETRTEMGEAQGRLFETYRNQDVFVPEGSVSSLTGSISRLNQEHVEAQARRITIEAAVQQAEEFLKKGTGLGSIPQVAADPTISGLEDRLGALTLELSTLKERFRDKHPEVQRIYTQQQSLREARTARAEQIIEAMRVEHAQLRKREQELKDAVEAKMEEAASQSQRGAELELLKKESESASGLYDVLLQKLNQSDIASSISVNNPRVVELASVPRAPVYPNKTRMAGVALLVGCALGVGLVLGRDFLDNTIKGPEEVEHYLHLDVLAAVPRYGQELTHLVTEAYQALRTALIFARKREGGHVVLVASSAPQEGKTTTIVNLAKLLASAGEKTVTIDFDLRRANLHNRLGLHREPGITDYFIGRSTIDQLLKPTAHENLFALTAGPLPPNPPALLARRQLGELLDELRGRFDWVLLDSPPLASVTDAILLARHADSTIMVIQHNKVDKKVIRRMVNALRKATPDVLGAVLNVVDEKSQGYYYYYYQHDSGHAKKLAGRGSSAGPA